MRWRAMRSSWTLKVHGGEGQIPVYVRSVSGRPDARLKICDLPEVPVCLSFTEGAVCSHWLISLGGSESRSQQMVNMSIYSEMQRDS